VFPQTTLQVEPSAMVTFTVWNENSLTSDDVIGNCTIGPLGATYGHGTLVDTWLPLNDNKGAPRAGEIHVQIQMTRAGGAPMGEAAAGGVSRCRLDCDCGAAFSAICCAVRRGVPSTMVVCVCRCSPSPRWHLPGRCSRVPRR
jgi:hypothetical protein